ncbi:hypothetical protein DM01DRAFT_1366815 [Hesseltinella vesiculosa]|uniref:Ras-GAP domain-containing protein n=1 Tax=Hesseltinella vesiculosa TaxID=101127 RepID=A0A1X2GJP0_9FUNG|nr:hypothetical protein DM01DRAFT_1366815 [Hesseltinella vesiculosa]
MRSNTKLILSLINRVAVRLPINSGRQIENLEHDPIVQQTVAAIIELSSYKLSTIANALTTVLENVSKHYQITSDYQLVPKDALQSQLFILRLLSACMQHHWNTYREQSLRSKDGDEANAAAAATGVSSSPSPRDSVDIDKTNLINVSAYVPPLDDALASFILVLMNRFLNQMHLIEEASDPDLAPDNSTNTNALSHLDPVSLEIMTDIYKVAGRVLYYVSASNWTMYYTKIKSAVQMLGSVHDGASTNPPDIRMLECCCLTRFRLHAILTDLSPYYLHMKRQGKLLYSKMIRRAIWRWIDTFPGEFEQVCANDQRLLGGSEILFDMCNSSADTAKKRAVIWPLQTILLALLPDLLLQAFLDNPSSQNRRTGFLGTLRKSLKMSRHADVAALCYVDLCKAATYIRPDDDSVLHHIASDIDVDLREKIWANLAEASSTTSLASASSTSNNSVDLLILATDYLLTRFKLDTKTTLADLAPSCIEESAPILLKMALVKACLVIAEEENRLPWNPSLENMYDPLCSIIRTLFIQVAASELPTVGQPVRSKQLKTIELLQDILKLYKVHPLLALLGDEPEKKTIMMVWVANLVQHPDPIVRQCSADCLAKLHSTTNIAHWGPPEALLPTFWSISSQITYSLARHTLDERLPEDNVKQVLSLLIKLFKTRVDFLRKASLTADSPATKERLQSAVTLEIALLTALCSPSPDICSDALRCLGYLCEESEFTNDDDDQQFLEITYLGNLPVYFELTSEEAVFLGRKAQQKRIRKILHRVRVPSPGNLAAWEEVWKRWKALTNYVRQIDDYPGLHPSGSAGLQSPTNPASSLHHGSSTLASGTTSTLTSSSSGNDTSALIGPKSPVSASMPTVAGSGSSLLKDRGISRGASDDDKPTEWQNYTGFLCSLGVCGVVEQDGPLANSNRLSDNSASNGGGSTTSSNHNYASLIPSEPWMMVNRFMEDMTDLLISDQAFIRETVKDALGNDLSPALYAILFRHLTARTSALFSTPSSPTASTNTKKQPICTTQNTLFVEQSASVLRLILERLVHASDTLMNIEFGSFLLQFSRYVNALPSNYQALRIKIRMCQLIDACMAKMQQIVVGNETHLRNQLLSIIKGWTSDADFKSLANSTTQNDKLQLELDQACLKAMVGLLHHLPLQTLTPVRSTDTFHMKSRLFYDYFEFFLKILSSCRQYENKHSSHDKNPAVDLLHLKNHTVAAMTNMLSANIDAGLKFSLAMGYHEDPSTRSAFIQVLTNILNQGVELDTLADNVTTSLYDKLIDMLVGPDLDVALSLCEVCPSMDSSGLVDVLLACFETRRRELPFMKAVIEREVETTEQEATLLRGTTIGIKFISMFAKTMCIDYVRQTIQPVLETINSWPAEDTTYELDPQKLSSTEDLTRNRNNVVRSTEMLLDAICSSSNNAPRKFRQELSLIVEAVKKRFPESKYTAVGGVVILRLFGPSIVSPEHAGFAKSAIPKSLNVRKLLLQATRVIQNLANNVLFGSKETHMIVLNDFLTSNIYRVTSFLREISAPSTSPSDTNDSPNLIYMDQTGYIRIHRYLSENIERITHDLASRRSRSGSIAQSQSLLEVKRTMDRMSNLLAQLGQPAELSDMALTHTRGNTAKDQQLLEFMKRSAHRDFSAYSSSNFFYLGDKSRAGHPIFYLVSRNVDSENMDFEVATTYMLRVMEPHLSNPFEILFDLTYLDGVCEIPVHWTAYFFQLIGNYMADYLVTIYLHNPNFHFRSYIRRFPRPLLNMLVKKVIFTTSIDDLSQYVSPSNIRLPKYTIDLDAEQYTIFQNVTRQTNLKSSLPVSVRISNEHVVILTNRPVDLVPGLNTVIKDCMHISNIEDMKGLPSSKQDGSGDISFKYEHGKAPMILSSNKRDAMLALIRYNKQNYERTMPGGIHERPMRPSDVPGRLLSMALLNIGNDDPGIRLAAYNLLHALGVTFHLDMANQLLNALDLCIPANSTEFLVTISERIASSEQQLTLDFLSECLIGFHKSSVPMRQLCLDYMAPWLRNLALYTRPNQDDHNKNYTKTKDVIRLLIELTVSYPDMYKHIQAKVWKVVANVDELINLILDSFIQFAVEHDVGSPQAEAMADTFVTLSSVTVRGKVISRLRKVLQCTSLRPCRQLTDHPAWKEVSILLRFVLMLSFNNVGPVKPYLPELFHIVSLLVGTGSTMMRASVHELVVNIIHTLCTTAPLTDDNVQKLHFILGEVCEPKNRIYFGLTKNHASAFTITPETMALRTDRMDLTSLESLVRLLLEAVYFGSPSVDIANTWRARWMSLITSTAFQFNPAIQPRAFVALGCLSTDEVDDDLVYQILVALRGALAIFNETDANLIISIMMCLSNIIDHMPSSSRYLRPLFWLALAMVQMNHPPTFGPAVRFLQSVLRALDSHKVFDNQSMASVLLQEREPLADICRELDNANDVSFDTHFSFAIAGILFRGLQAVQISSLNGRTGGSGGAGATTSSGGASVMGADPDSDRESVYQCLTLFLEIDCKRSLEQQLLVEAKSLGYLASLLPLAARNNALRELLGLAGINEVDLDNIDLDTKHPANQDFTGALTGQVRLFDTLEIPDNTTALLLVSFLVNLLNTTENEYERLFLYRILSDASVAIPEVFSLVYDSLLPKMNQVAISSQNIAIIDAVKGILMTACSEPSFYQPPGRKSQNAYLNDLGFSCLADPNFGAANINPSSNAQHVSVLLERITE